jgi:hypothetical protein
MKFSSTFSLVAASAIWLAGCGNADMTFREVPGNQSAGANAEANPESGSADQTGVTPAGESQEGTNGCASGPTQVVVQGGTGEQPTVISVDVQDGASQVAGEENGETMGSDGDVAETGQEPAVEGSEGGMPASDGIAAESGSDDDEDCDKEESGHGKKDGKKKDHHGDHVATGSESAKAFCAEKHGTTLDNVKVIGSEKSIVLQGDELLMIRVSGNKSSVRISTQAGEGAPAVRGICVFAAGNQTVVSADLNINVGSLAYFGTGNQSKGHISVGEEYELGKLAVSLRGNQASFKIDGEGKYECGAPELKGNGPVFTCKN